MKKISIFGLGQVGLSTAVVIASKGLQVIGVDIDKNKIKMIHDGNSLFFEPNLKEMLEDVLDKKSLYAYAGPSDCSFLQRSEAANLTVAAYTAA